MPDDPMALLLVDFQVGLSEQLWTLTARADEHGALDAEPACAENITNRNIGSHRPLTSEHLHYHHVDRPVGS